MTAAPDTGGTLASGPLTGFEAVNRAVARADAARGVTEPEPAPANSTTPDSPSAAENARGNTANAPERVADQSIARGLSDPPGTQPDAGAQRGSPDDQ